jgi:signal transduction histidine kinase
MWMLCNASAPNSLFLLLLLLLKVLLNVLNNAVKFTESGEILLEIWPEPVTPQQQQQQVSLVTPQQQGSLVTLVTPQDCVVGGSSSSSGAFTQQGGSSSSGSGAVQYGSSSGSGSGVAPGGPDEWPTRMIRFSVKDTGIGISQGDLGKLFKSFSQVRHL